jgi:hypothetical protein
MRSPARLPGNDLQGKNKAKEKKNAGNHRQPRQLPMLLNLDNTRTHKSTPADPIHMQLLLAPSSPVLSA